MGNKIINISIVILLTLCLGCHRDGPLLIDVSTSTISNTLDKAIPTLMEKHNVAGLSVIVLHDGEVSISKSFGFADLEAKRKIDEHTVFRAASFGKPVFAYIVVSLAQQGKIDLDLPLYSYLKEEVVKGDSRSKIITARMVLTHTTGLPNLDGKKSDAEFKFDPGKDFKYSGHAYLYLQKVVEKITGKHLNKLANEIVFKPLKMTDSSYIWHKEYESQLAMSYDDSGKAFLTKAEPEHGHSAWSLLTTTKDYARFVSHMIETSNRQGSIAEPMLRPYVDVAAGVKWGLGWGLQDTVPNRSFWHWGSMAGFRHYIVGYPKERIAVIVMTNSWRSFKIVDEVMAKAIGGSYPSYDWF
jgi:CubicO group peptidase (beta-lactamase class C family)